MDIDVSIIIICHNKYPQNLYVLYSLEKQTYNPVKMEVILVDDNSSDQTFSLKNYKGPFHYKYCRSSINLGRAGAKNFGLKQAEGEIVIFMDGEVMVTSNFVANHIRHHNKAQEVAVSGVTSHYNIFSFLHPGFSKKQIRVLHACLRNEPLLSDRLTQYSGLPYEDLHYFTKFWRSTRGNQKLVPLLTEEDIADQQFKFTFPAPFFPPQIMEKYSNNLSNYHLAWTFFITRNASVSKRALDAVGPFNEEFSGWGSEDWELGYRLYKNGVGFIEDQDIVSFHQEHPFPLKERTKEKMQNYATFTALHPDIEVCAVTLGLLRKRNLLQINHLIDDYYHLKNEFSDQFINIENAFIKMTQQIPIILAEGKPVTRLLLQAGLEEKTKIKEMLSKEMEALRKPGEYSYYLNTLQLLLDL